MDIGRKIFFARKQLGKKFTQAWLSDELNKLGVKTLRSWVANVEAGRVASLNRETLDSLSKILKKPIEYFGDVEIRNDPPLIMNLPLILRKKIDEEAQKKMMTVETLISVILSEYFTKKLGEHK